MYGWIWRKLPGNWAAKLAGCLVLFLAVTALLFIVIFPYVEPKLPWNNVTVSGTSTTTTTTSTPPSPSTTHSPHH